MQKSISLALAVSLVLTGCGAFHRSGTWATVTSARIDTRHEADPSKAYAAQLSHTLSAAHVEHKVVTYQYRYRTRLREEAIGTRTAVVYRDATSTRNPWWIMDEQLKKPLWLPGNDLNRQVTFYLRDEAEVVETNGGPVTGGGKSLIAPAPAMREREATGIARLEPQRKSDRSRSLFARTPIKKAAVPTMLAVRNDQPRSWLRPARFAPVNNAPFLPAPAATVPLPPVAGSFATIFRSVHRSAFDPTSPVDRRKMEQLEQAALRRGNGPRAF